MEMLDELRERIERTVREKSAERAAWPDLDLEAMAPAVRRQQVRDREIFNARLASLGSGLGVLSKLAGRLSEWRDVRPQQTRQAMRDIEADGAAAQRHDVRDACDLAKEYLLGKIRDGGGMPGACTAWCVKHGVDRIMPLPMIEEFRQKAEADLQPVVERLQTELDAFDVRIVHGSIDANLPTLESHGTARVTNRATAG